LSLGKRLYNIARAEIRSAWEKLESIGDDDPEFDRLDAELREAERRYQEAAGNDIRKDDFPPHVSRWYANLELPIGAESEEIRAAYRRLMRRFHPDRHHGDSVKAEVATQLATKLRDAHDGLIDFLGSR